MRTFSGIQKTMVPVLMMILCFVYSQAMAASVRMSWNPHNKPSSLRYHVYYGTSSHAYSTALDAGSSSTIEIDDLEAGKTYYMAVTAYNTAGESDFSDEVRVTIPTSTSSGGGCFITTSIPKNRLP
jgi:hypothetical protein